ncbi:hypothetical protein G6O69_17045 [Pseudenhygromyxa sp. WMMC2535]|uniref:hypothetical protein n=1 Tax=Pseudenhygromyxa sp. WMMC2535 TaxID=2712867 RepID=UPI0015950BD2|nr:hypothetical protein [Pseudenhygromyxa sp. WMMC2535]NVB39552.1 hypothetical protein [Pseudenhygromyxa sp. WMMC2535]
MDIDGEKVVYQDTQKILVNYRVDDQRMHDKLIGDWEGAECSGGTSYSYVTRYTDDGHWRSEGTMVSGKVSMEYENEGTWTLSGGVLERKVTRSNLPHLQGGVLTSKILFMTTDTMAVRDSDGQAVYSFKVAHNMVSSDRDEVLALNQLGSWRGVETFDAVQYRYVTTFSRDGRWLTRGVQAADGVTKEYQEEGGWEVKGGKLRYRIDLPTTPKTRDLTLSHEIFYTTVGTGMYGTPGANRIYLYQVSDHEVPIM